MAPRSLLRIGVYCIALFSGSALAASDPDPWEPLNRKIMGFNDAADGAVLKPIARGYTAVVPGPLRTGVTNFFANLRDPWISLNQLLQGKPGSFASDLGRFGINSTLDWSVSSTSRPTWGLKNTTRTSGRPWAYGAWARVPTSWCRCGGPAASATASAISPDLGVPAVLPR